MRLAYRGDSGGSCGFTADDFRATASEVAGPIWRDGLKRTVSSTQELDYDDALDWYGLRFAAGT